MKKHTCDVSTMHDLGLRVGKVRRPLFVWPCFISPIMLRASRARSQAGALGFGFILSKIRGEGVGAGG